MLLRLVLLLCTALAADATKSKTTCSCSAKATCSTLTLNNSDSRSTTLSLACDNLVCSNVFCLSSFLSAYYTARRNRSLPVFNQNVRETPTNSSIVGVVVVLLLPTLTTQYWWSAQTSLRYTLYNVEIGRRKEQSCVTVELPRVARVSLLGHSRVPGTVFDVDP